MIILSQTRSKSKEEKGKLTKKKPEKNKSKPNYIYTPNQQEKAK
jgi:hypothetical protein